MYNKILLSIQKKINKISKQQIIYKGHDFTQALYRLYYTETRGYKNPNNLKIFDFIKNAIVKLPLSSVFLKKEKTDLMVISNTRYKIQKVLDTINLGSRNKTAIVQDFKHNSYFTYNHKNYFIVKKFLFFQKIIT